jgi:hypothetical protein
MRGRMSGGKEDGLGKGAKGKKMGGVGHKTEATLFHSRYRNTNPPHTNRIQYGRYVPIERHRRAPGLGRHGAGEGRNDDRAGLGLPIASTSHQLSVFRFQVCSWRGCVVDFRPRKATEPAAAAPDANAPAAADATRTRRGGGKKESSKKKTHQNTSTTTHCLPPVCTHAPCTSSTPRGGWARRRSRGRAARREERSCGVTWCARNLCFERG